MAASYSSMSGATCAALVTQEGTVADESDTAWSNVSIMQRPDRRAKHGSFYPQMWAASNRCALLVRRQRRIEPSHCAPVSESGGVASSARDSMGIDSSDKHSNLGPPGTQRGPARRPCA